jgi:hypothetical protein
VQGLLAWSSTVPASSRVPLEESALRIGGPLARPQPDDIVLLAAGDTPLVLSRHGATPLLETPLDFSSPSADGRPDIPLLVDFLFARLLGSSLLDQIATVERGPYAAAVAPIQRLSTRPGTNTRRAVRVRDLTQPFLTVALLMLLWEIVALGRSWLRLRIHTRALSE